MDDQGDFYDEKKICYDDEVRDYGVVIKTRELHDVVAISSNLLGWCVVKTVSILSQPLTRVNRFSGVSRYDSLLGETHLNFLLVKKENQAKFVAIFLKIVGWVERIPLIIVDFRGVFECPICLNMPKFSETQH